MIPLFRWHRHFLLTLLCSTTFIFAKAQPAVDLDTLIEHYQSHESYDSEKYPLGKYDEELARTEAEFARQMLRDLAAIDAKSLSHSERISKELLRFQLQDKADHYTYKMYLNPIQADQGFHLDLNYQVQPINTYSAGLHYLEKLKAIPYFARSQIVLMKKGLKEGIGQPKIIFKGYESTYDTHIVSEAEESYFYSPFKELPASITAERQDSLRGAALQVVGDSVIPAFKLIKSFFETQYIPQSRDAIGVSSEPDGADFYQNRINYYTTSTEYTAKSIHELGLREVARIHGEMENIIESTGFDGSFADFFAFLRTDPQFYKTDGRELLKTARDISKRLDAKLPAYFSLLPRKPYGVRKVPDAIAPKYTSGRYSGSSKGSTQPGWFLVNTYQLDSRTLYTLPALAAHEAVPGHHLQTSLAQELGDSIPQFRRDMYLSAYGEGWALYCEYLADEMGIYTTPYEKFGQLTYEMWRACRLVIDTGIHAFGWTRDEAVNYMATNTALSLHEINTEIDRYIGWPGQALSYKIGEMKIREMRKKAEEKLGDKFDIRAFHKVILGKGTVTLPILEKLVDDYIEDSI